MKLTIHKHTSREHLLRAQPEPFRSLLPPNLAEPITAVLFGDRFATERLARKALAQIAEADSESIIFCARSFTTEAQELLSQHHIVLVAPLGHLLWSDHYHERFRVRTGATVKKPSIPYAPTNDA